MRIGGNENWMHSAAVKLFSVSVNQLDTVWLDLFWGVERRERTDTGICVCGCELLMNLCLHNFACCSGCDLL